jgi:alpha-L-fucosidase
LKDANTFYQFSRNQFPQGDITIRSLDSAAQAYSVNLQNFIVELPRATKMNCIVLREAIHFGQTIRKFRIVFNNGRRVVREVNGSSVGRKKIITFKTITATSFTVYLEDARGMDNIIGVTAYLMKEDLLEK